MDNLMEYKGYHAKIEFSADDNILVGRVLGINDVIAFDGESIQELSDAFHESIDDYLTTCAELGKSPDKEYKGTFNVRIQPELHKKAVIKAESQNISLNQFIQQAIEHEVSGYDTRDVVKIVMPAQIIGKYSFSKESDPFVRYDFGGEEDSKVWKNVIRFPASVS